jgi:hypothetical protein
MEGRLIQDLMAQLQPTLSDQPMLALLAGMLCLLGIQSLLITQTPSRTLAEAAVVVVLHIYQLIL